MRRRIALQVAMKDKATAVDPHNIAKQAETAVTPGLLQVHHTISIHLALSLHQERQH